MDQIKLKMIGYHFTEYLRSEVSIKIWNLGNFNSDEGEDLILENYKFEVSVYEGFRGEGIRFISQ